MPIVEYRCKFCERLHRERTAAVACEKTHLRVKSAKPRSYRGGPYPTLIDVAFPDGNTKIYVMEDDYWRK